MCKRAEKIYELLHFLFPEYLRLTYWIKVTPISGHEVPLFRSPRKIFVKNKSRFNQSAKISSVIFKGSPMHLWNVLLWFIRIDPCCTKRKAILFIKLMELEFSSIELREVESRKQCDWQSVIRKWSSKFTK